MFLVFVQLALSQSNPADYYYLCMDTAPVHGDPTPVLIESGGVSTIKY
jgi:hypothetical protein